MPTKPFIVNCPTCGASVTWSALQRWRPFCSDRCRLIDLGAWADESHRLPAQTDDILEFIDETAMFSDPSADPTRN